MAFQSLNEFYKEVLEREKKVRIAGFYAIIPLFILEDRKLSDTAKLLYGEISSLTNKFGYCYATSKHFYTLLGCSRSTIKRGLKQLEKQGYIRIEIEKNKTGTYRKVWITCGKVGGGGSKMTHGVGQK